MTIREILNYAFLFALYVVLQILIVRNLVLFDYAFCFVYIAALILLPYELSMTVYLLIAFVTGVVIDTFYNTLGMHAAASVLLVYCRPAVTRVLIEQPGQDFRPELTLQEMGSSAFFRYVLTMALIHHAALFFIEASSLSLFVPTLIRTVASAVLTTISVVLIQFFTRN